MAAVTGTTRRGLLAAGAGAGLVVAGCGAPEEPPPDAELLAPSLAAAIALADAYERAGGRIGRELAVRERAHAERLRAAGAGEARAPEPPNGAPLEAALALEQAAMRAHVHAVGLVRAPRARSLAAELLADDARHVLVVSERLGRDAKPGAFPDGRGV